MADKTPEERALDLLRQGMTHGEKPEGGSSLVDPVKAFVGEQEKPHTGRGGLSALGYGILKGASYGGDDEAAAYLTDADVEETRANRKLSETADPFAFKSGELLGAFGTGVAPVMGAMRLARGSGLLGQSAMGGAAGLAQGVTQGFLEGEGGFVNRMKNAWNPVKLGVGTAVGAAIPGAGRIAGVLAGTGPRSGVSALARQGMSRPAARELARRFDDDSLIRDTRAYLDELGPEATLADAGPSMRGLASKGATTMDGPQRPMIYGAVTGRGADAPDRIGGAIDDTLGHRQNMEAVREAMDAYRTRWANPEYTRFHDTMFPLTPELRETLRRASSAGALREARTIARAEGFDINQSMFTDPGNVEISGRALDYISRGLRDTAASRARSGATGAGHSLRELNDRLLSGVPDLRAIRHRFSDEMDIREATEAGRDIFSNTVSADAFAARWAAMSDGERAAMRLAARDAIEQRMAGAVNETNAGVNLLGPRSVVAKLETIYGPDAVRELRRTVDAERVFRDTRNTIVRDTELSPRYPGQENPFGTPTGGVKPSFSISEMMARALHAGGRSAGTRQDIISRDLASALTARGTERDRLVAALIADQRRRTTRQARSGRYEELTRLLLSGLPASTMAGIPE